jgi:hypothetical protein
MFQRRKTEEEMDEDPVPREDHVPQSQVFLIHYYVSEEGTREEEEMDEDPVPGEDHVPQSQVLLIYYYVLEEDPEKRRKWTRRRSSDSRKRSCSSVLSVPNPLLCFRRRHQRRGGDG